MLEAIRGIGLIEMPRHRTKVCPWHQAATPSVDAHLEIAVFKTPLEGPAASVSHWQYGGI
jgi:hypothetical protein